MSNTPRTDAATVRMERLDGDIDEVVSADFARTLERELIAALAVKHLAAQELFHRLGMQNIYGKTSDEREQQAKEYAVAIADMQQAAADLRAAQEPK